MQWSVWRENDIPEVEDFAHHFDNVTGNLYSFGGYQNGTKTNMLFKLDVNTKTARILSPNIPSNVRLATHVPCQRTSSRIVLSKKLNCLFLFGGLTAANDTLNDMWRYDLEVNRWDKIEQKGRVPGPRCGHSFNIHSEKIFLFGGLQAVTLENNETMKFDIATETWEEIGQSVITNNSVFETLSPTPSSRIQDESTSFAALVKKESLMDTIQPALGSHDNSMVSSP